jgi:hypothetical protein
MTSDEKDPENFKSKFAYAYLTGFVKKLKGDKDDLENVPID